VRHEPPSRLLASIQRARVRTDVVGAGTTRIRISSRWARMLGFDVSAYLVGGLLVDTGFAHVRRQILELLDGRRIAAVCCTHNHEDHTGNCGPIGDRHRCPVFLRHHRLRWGEGVRRLKPYRAWWWGAPGRFPAEEMPELVSDGDRRLRALPAPGHSATHVALWEEATATVFTGDLFIAPGASAVMVQENPYDLADSLRRVAAVEPRWMLTGHGLVVADPGPKLLAKAERIELAAARAVELHRAGMADRAIVRELFPNGNRRDRMIEALTQGEFSRLNFVRAAVEHDREP
jgi:glyoxylase-like metal-dependent hydrolase (beta-lactamase superfamily II)